MLPVYTRALAEVNTDNDKQTARSRYWIICAPVFYLNQQEDIVQK